MPKNEKMLSLQNKKAPAFTLTNQDGKKISLKDYLGKKVLVYFYPKAMTPGCTVQACGVRDQKKSFSSINTVVVGISPDKPEKLKKFQEKEMLNFDLLSDEDHKIADKYGAWGEKKLYGKTYMGLIRSSFLVDEKGFIVHVMDKVKTKTHHDDFINIIKEL